MTNRHSKKRRGRSPLAASPNHDKYGRPKQGAVKTLNDNSRAMAQALKEMEKDNGRNG